MAKLRKWIQRCSKHMAHKMLRISTSEPVDSIGGSINDIKTVAKIVAVTPQTEEKENKRDSFIEC